MQQVMHFIPSTENAQCNTDDAKLQICLQRAFAKGVVLTSRLEDGNQFGYLRGLVGVSVGRYPELPIALH